MKKAREVVTYKDYFEEFFEKQSQKVRDKICLLYTSDAADD